MNIHFFYDTISIQKYGGKGRQYMSYAYFGEKLIKEKIYLQDSEYDSSSRLMDENEYKAHIFLDIDTWALEIVTDANKVEEYKNNLIDPFDYFSIPRVYKGHGVVKTGSSWVGEDMYFNYYDYDRDKAFSVWSRDPQPSTYGYTETADNMIEITDEIKRARKEKPYQLPYEKSNINDLTIERDLTFDEYVKYKKAKEARLAKLESLKKPEEKCQWVKYDANHKPLYGFIINGRGIYKFVNFSKTVPTEIELPPLLVENPKNDGRFDLTNEQALDALHKFEYMQQSPLYGEYLEKYLSGAYSICSQCFSDVQNVKLIVPTNCSVVLGANCFAPNAHVELVLPADTALKTVHQDIHSAYIRDFSSSWLVVTSKRFSLKNYSDPNRGLRMYTEDTLSSEDAKTFTVSKDMLVKHGNAFVYKTADKMYTKKTEDENDAMHVRK